MRVEFKNLHFLIEAPGPAMTLITNWLAERDAVLARNKVLADDLGVTKYHFDRDTGVLTGALFETAPVPTDWRKPGKHGISWPKKNSDWAKRIAAQVGHRKASDLIRETLAIPTYMQCEKADGSRRGIDMGHWFEPCQFATVGMTAPYLLVIPNVAFYVAEAEAEGWVVPAAVKAFEPVFEGCRRIARDDWDLMVLQRKAAQRQAKEGGAACK